MALQSSLVAGPECACSPPAVRAPVTHSGFPPVLVSKRISSCIASQTSRLPSVLLQDAVGHAARLRCSGPCAPGALVNSHRYTQARDAYDGSSQVRTLLPA